jgi:hypothetical protein
MFAVLGASCATIAPGMCFSVGGGLSWLPAAVLACVVLHTCRRARGGQLQIRSYDIPLPACLVVPDVGEAGAQL